MTYQDVEDIAYDAELRKAEEHYNDLYDDYDDEYGEHHPTPEEIRAMWNSPNRNIYYEEGLI